MKKILIALDYNPSAQKIAETGYAMAKAMNASVTLIHVMADPVYYSSLEYSPIMGYSGFTAGDMLHVEEGVELRKAAQSFLGKTKSHLGDEAIETIVGEGDCATALLDTVQELAIDIVVMGSHSRSGLEKILMGSITEKVLHHTPIPLFIIPTGKEKS